MKRIKTFTEQLQGQLKVEESKKQNPNWIKAPYLKIEGKNFFRYSEIWYNFVEQYNKGKKNGEHLKTAHKLIFYKLIEMCAETINRRNKLLQGSELMGMYNNEPFKIKTNRKTLKDRTFRQDKVKRSISNYLDRLIEAKVISKNFLGTKADFELLINPDFLLIFDYEDENYKPISKFSTEKMLMEKRELRRNKVKILHLMFSEEKLKTFNKLIITDGASLSLRINDLPTENISENISENPQRKNTGENSKTTPTSYKTELKTEKEKNSAKKEKETKKTPQIDPYQEMVKSFAIIFYLYMKSKLFENHTINPAHKQKTIDYIAEHYFFQSKRWYNEKELEKQLHHYQERIDMAKEFVERKKYDTKWIFPLNYLDINSSKGFKFKNTEEWYERRVRTYAKRDAQRIVNSKDTSNAEKVNLMIELFAQKPTEIQLTYCNFYMKNALPKYQDEFNKRIRQSRAVATNNT